MGRGGEGELSEGKRGKEVDGEEKWRTRDRGRGNMEGESGEGNQKV